MLIVVEGVDGSGKSTLVQTIADKLRFFSGATVTHLGPPQTPSSALAECIDDEPFGSYAPNTDFHIVADRLHWGCPVYGPVYRPELDVDGYGDFGRAGWRYAELHLASRGCVSVLVDVRPETAARRVKDRNSENFYTVEQIQERLTDLIARYRWLAPDSLTMALQVLEPDRGQLPVIADSIIRAAKAREFEVHYLAPFPSYIGTAFPSTLVIAPPVREERLILLNELRDDVWQSVGVCNSNYSTAQLEYLYRAIDAPSKIIGVEPLSQDADAFIYQLDGKVVSSVEQAAQLVV